MCLVNNMKTMETDECFKKLSNPTSKGINNRFLYLWSHYSAMYDLVQKCNKCTQTQVGNAGAKKT